jgi:DNA-binding IclR family transcriptional regulator
VTDHKCTPARLPFSQWPVSLLSHDVLSPNATVNLSPLARVRERGQIGNVAKSAVRALDIVELLAQIGKPMRAVDITKALGLSSSSTHQLLKTMMDSAYLIFDPVSKLYHPSLRSANISGSLADRHFAAGAINCLVNAVQQRFQTALTISASQGSFMQILEVFEPRRDEPNITREFHGLREEAIGLRVPIFGSCTGAAWLSAQSDETVLAIARLCRRALGARGSATEQILEIVRRARTQGYAFGGISADDSRRSIAVPFPPSRHGIVLVIAASAPAEEISERRDEIVGLLNNNIHRYLTGIDSAKSERAAGSPITR